MGRHLGVSTYEDLERHMRVVCEYPVASRIQSRQGAGTWDSADPRTGQQAMPSPGIQVDQADVVGGDPEENPGSPLVIWILHIGGP